MFDAVMFTLTTIASVIVVIGIDAVRRSITRGQMGLSTAVMSDYTVKQHNCTQCSGGIQTLNDVLVNEQLVSQWGPFTPAQLSVSTASPYLESSSANTRRCLACAGKSFLWEDVPIDHGYKPPNMGHIEELRKHTHWPWS
jgi:hypothetical protein